MSGCSAAARHSPLCDLDLPVDPGQLRDSSLGSSRTAAEQNDAFFAPLRGFVKLLSGATQCDLYSDSRKRIQLLKTDHTLPPGLCLFRIITPPCRNRRHLVNEMISLLVV